MCSSPRRWLAPLAVSIATIANVHDAAAQPKPSPSSTASTALPAAPAPKPAPPKPATKPKDTGVTSPASGAAAGTSPTVAPAPTDAPPQSPPPPAWTSGSTSTSGTQLLPPPPATVPPPPPTVAAVSGVDPAEEADRDRRIRTLEQRLDAAEAANKENDEKLWWLKRFKVSGYVQPQLLWQWFNAAASPNNLASGSLPMGINSNDVVAQASTVNGVGTTTNGDFFRLRRARLKTEFMPTDYARLVFEIDPTPAGGATSGIGTIARDVEAQGIVHWSSDWTTTFGMGIFKVPIDFEVLQSDADRPFIERSWGERNMFPGEFDTGAKAYTQGLNDRLLFQVAIVNGNMEGEKTFSAIPDLNKGKDLVGRLNYNFGPLDVGIGGYYGQGQIVDPVGLRFKQFPRWAGNIELALHHTFIKALGQSRLFAEALLARDMDRGVNYNPALVVPSFPADVVNGTVNDFDERSTWFRIEQDLGDWVTLALRYDFYTPDSAQKNDGRDTYGAVAVVHFTKGLQYMLEVDHAIDNVHQPGATPPSKQIESLSNVLQARF
jgi:hypothetical protein